MPTVYFQKPGLGVSNCGSSSWCGFYSVSAKWSYLQLPPTRTQLRSNVTATRQLFFFFLQCLPCQLSTPDIGRIRFDSSSWGLAIGRAPGTLCLKRGIHHHGVWEQEKQSIRWWDTQAPLEIEACLETSGWGEGGWKGPSEGIRRWEVKVWVLTATQTLRRDTRFRTQRAGDSVNQPAEKGLHSTALSDLKDSVALRVKCSVALLWKMAVIRGWKYVLF